MATTTFNTRISLKYDTYAQWVEKDPQLLVGEVAVVVVPAETGAVAKEPAVLFKVGDGAHKFSELQFTAGLAADVYDWAKAASKPTYSANEIDGLSDYISGEIQDPIISKGTPFAISGERLQNSAFGANKSKNERRFLCQS